MSTSVEQAPGWKKAVFVIVGLGASTPWSNAPLALGVGCVLALAGVAAWPKLCKATSRQLIQWCVATLGLIVPMGELFAIAREGMAFAVGTIAMTFALGALLDRLLRTGAEQTVLISSGTAICGGSAIAAVGSAIGASSAGMAIATGAVFLLNAVALYAFPAVGHWLGLSDAQFGTWAGIAIHDVSSVTGAAGGYVAAGGVAGAALRTATVVKLSRVLWIVPIALGASWWTRRKSPGNASRAPVPWLIILFVLASGARSLFPAVGEHAEAIRRVAGLGFQMALFLIGSGLSVAALRRVGWRALAQAVTLWVVIGVVSLVVVRATVK